MNHMIPLHSPTLFRLGGFSCLLLLLSACSTTPPVVRETPTKPYNPQVDRKYTFASTGDEIAVIETKFGIMVMEFDTTSAPQHVQNFKNLAGQGFYNGTLFHRVCPASSFKEATRNHARTNAAPNGALAIRATPCHPRFNCPMCGAQLRRPVSGTTSIRGASPMAHNSTSSFRTPHRLTMPIRFSVKSSRAWMSPTRSQAKPRTRRTFLSMTFR